MSFLELASCKVKNIANRILKMDSERRVVLCTFFVCTALCIATCISIISVRDWAIKTTEIELETTEAHLHTEEVYVEHGYSQKFLPGNAQLVWEKSGSTEMSSINMKH